MLNVLEFYRGFQIRQHSNQEPYNSLQKSGIVCAHCGEGGERTYRNLRETVSQTLDPIATGFHFTIGPCREDIMPVLAIEYSCRTSDEETTIGTIITNFRKGIDTLIEEAHQAYLLAFHPSEQELEG